MRRPTCRVSAIRPTAIWTRCTSYRTWSEPNLVHLVVGAEGYDVGGIADTLGAFGLTHYRADGGTLAHELGHNMGLHHDRYDTCRVECTSWPYRFAYGYVNRRAFGPLPSSPAQWRTLMASDAQCRAQGMRCRGLLRFSNPYQAYRGDPLGISGERVSLDIGGPANAARVLNAMRHSVASIRDRVPGDRTGGTGGAFVFEGRTQKQSAPVRLPAIFERDGAPHAGGAGGAGGTPGSPRLRGCGAARSPSTRSGWRAWRRRPGPSRRPHWCSTCSTTSC